MNAVYDAAQFVDGSDPQFTWLIYKAGEARDFPVLLHGNVATPGEIVPRHFPAVLAKGDGLLKNGSGRLDLAEKIFTENTNGLMSVSDGARNDVPHDPRNDSWSLTVHVSPIFGFVVLPKSE